MTLKVMKCGLLYGFIYTRGHSLKTRQFILNASKFELTQQAFIENCVNNGLISENATHMGCIIELLEKIYND